MRFGQGQVFQGQREVKVPFGVLKSSSIVPCVLMNWSFHLVFLSPVWRCVPPPLCWDLFDAAALIKASHSIVCCWSFTVIDLGCVHWAVSRLHLCPRTSHITFRIGHWLMPQRSASLNLRENSVAGCKPHICKCKEAAGRWETSFIVFHLFVLPFGSLRKTYLTCTVVLLYLPKNNSLSLGCIRVVNYTNVHQGAIWNVNNRA